MDKLGIPALLLIAIWGGFNTVFKAMKIMIDRRDRFLGTAEHISGNHHPEMCVRRQLFLDWLPVWLGTTIGLFFFTMVIASVPFYVIQQDDSNSLITWGLCSFGACIPFFAAIAFVFGGVMDIKLYLRIRRKEAANLEFKENLEHQTSAICSDYYPVVQL